MTVIAYDKKSVYHRVLLDLPFREATGLITRDRAKPHHIASLAGHAPVWGEVALSGLGVLEFGAGLHRYLEIPAADTQDLDFTGDFTLAAWVFPIYTATALVIMCRNTTGEGAVGCGWCMYLYDSPTLGTLLSLRTNQVGSRTECYAAGFPESEWQLVGFSRDSAGLTATCYKNGQPITTVFNGIPLLNPVACGAANRLFIGRQEPVVGSYYEGNMWRPRAWPEKLAPEDWAQLFNCERHWFGV